MGTTTDVYQCPSDQGTNAHSYYEAMLTSAAPVDGDGRVPAGVESSVAMHLSDIFGST